MSLIRKIFLILLCSFFSTTAFAESGVSDNEIVLGADTIGSGPGAFYSIINKMAGKYFEEINSKGGVHGRTIKYVWEDSEWNPGKAVKNIRKLVQRERVFAIVGALSTTVKAYYKWLDVRNVPNVFIQDMATDYIEPVRQQTFTLFPSARNEAEFFAKYVVKNFKGKTIGTIYPEVDEGKFTIDLFRKIVEQNNQKLAAEDKIKLGPSVMLSYLSTDANSQVLDMKNAGVDVIVAVAVPPASPSAVKYAKSIGYDVKWLMSLYNNNFSFLDLAGSAGEGVIVPGWLKSVTSKDESVVKHKNFLKKHFPNEKPGNLSMAGQVIAEATIEALNRAGKDLTRAKFVNAIEGMSGWTCSVCLEPFKLSKADHQPLDKYLPFMVQNGEFVPLSD